MYREHREVLKLIECQLLKKTIESNLDSLKEFSRNMLTESQKSMQNQISSCLSSPLVLYLLNTNDGKRNKQSIGIVYAPELKKLTLALNLMV